LAGRRSRQRDPDLVIAATVASNQLPLSTANPDDLKGTEGLAGLVGVEARPDNR
jgi:predicted nucleic acid-binding protein